MTRSTKQEQRTRGADYEAPTPVPKAKRTRGRPSEYEAEFIPEAVALASAGATDAEIAEGLGIDRSTLRRWFLAYPELSAAVKAAKETIDRRVERSLFKRAVEDGDTTAHIFWLKNRQPDLWRERNQTELIVPVDDSPQELDHRSAALAALALFNSAVYDPTQPAGPVIEGHAREEIGHGETLEQDGTGRGAGRGNALDRAEAPDPDFDGHPFDLDPGEV